MLGHCFIEGSRGRGGRGGGEGMQQGTGGGGSQCSRAAGTVAGHHGRACAEGKHEGKAKARVMPGIDPLDLEEEIQVGSSWVLVGRVVSKPFSNPYAGALGPAEFLGHCLGECKGGAGHHCRLLMHC
jgi:hypothetical protein